MKISFCSTCKNRLWQLKQTIFKNLEDIRSDGNSELILINYGDTEGLDEFIQNNLLCAIMDKTLLYAKKDKVDLFAPSPAKNLAHFLATGDYVFNLDADNFINGEIPFYRKIWEREPLAVIHGNTKIFNDGSFGRIGLAASVFKQLGGYDEEIGSYYEDMDLLKRCIKFGMFYAKVVNEKKPSIKNSTAQTVEYTKFKGLNQIDCYWLNRAISDEKLEKNELVRNINRARAKLLKNFSEEVEI